MPEATKYKTTGLNKIIFTHMNIVNIPSMKEFRALCGAIVAKKARYFLSKNNSTPTFDMDSSLHTVYNICTIILYKNVAKLPPNIS